MKVLWYVNIVMPDAAKALGLLATNFGGWLSGQANAISQSVELAVVTVSNEVTNINHIKANSIDYFIFPAKGDFIEMFKETYSTLQPDFVHIHGTEYKYNTDLIEYCNRNNINNIVSIQGLAYECSNHYMDGLPKRFERVNPAIRLMKTVYTGSSVAMERQGFFIQGQNEIRALKTAKNVIGRTNWDKDCVMSINPDIRYFHVNENLREDFYSSEKWSYERCEKHSIFISQAYYPIKGFHQFLHALKDIKIFYPDVKVYVAGSPPCTLKNKILDVFVNYFFEYQGYIKGLIKKHHLEQNVVYTGSLFARQMKERYLKCNVFVSASTIENSPNSVGEAMILGVPVVASDVGGTATMLKDREEGILYDFYDTDALVAAISAIFDNEELAKKYSENSIIHAQQTHDREMNTKQLLEVYASILER